MIKKDDLEYLKVYPLSVGLLSLAWWFLYYRSKSLTVKDNAIQIKRFVKSKPDVYPVKTLIGYEEYETYDRTGLVTQIRIVTRHGKITFVKDAYSYDDYNALIRLIKSSGIQFLAFQPKRSKHKHKIGLLSSILFILAMLMFGLLKILETL